MLAFTYTVGIVNHVFLKLVIGHILKSDRVDLSEAVFILLY